MVRFDPFIVNLSGDQGRRYLRVILQVEVPNDEAKNAVTSHMPQLRDRLIFLLSSKKFSDIHSIDGKYQLREEILRHLNEALGKEIVKKVYFTEFIVQ
ncbi:MAG: hypothetical protein KatS3mg131_1271 [Candidatus Tectimicrobiota bacterium]|nr:MAG: hypothetical protein KatS3mg131_1271 [Candidatus Tectomicrobia bacterium]